MYSEKSVKHFLSNAINSLQESIMTCFLGLLLLFLYGLYMYLCVYFPEVVIHLIFVVVGLFLFYFVVTVLPSLTKI